MKLKTLFGGRVLQGQRYAVQGDRARDKRFAASIFAVAQNGAMDGRQLQAKLMLPPGVQADFDKGTSSLLAQCPIAEARMPRAAAARRHDLHAPLAVVLQQPVR